jgi:hypothetical protein
VCDICGLVELQGGRVDADALAAITPNEILHARKQGFSIPAPWRQV